LPQPKAPHNNSKISNKVVFGQDGKQILFASADTKVCHLTRIYDIFFCYASNKALGLKNNTRGYMPYLLIF
jgi:hypothetical protein